MSEEKLNWKALWENPFEVLSAIVDNHRLVLQLESLKNMINEDKDNKRAVKKGGFVYEKERKTALMTEIKDKKLADTISELSNQREIIAAIDARIEELKRIVKESEDSLKALAKEEESVTGAANKIVDRYIALIKELKIIYEKQIENIELNREYDAELVRVAHTEEFIAQIDTYIKESEKALNRSKENKASEEKANILLREVDRLCAEAQTVMHMYEAHDEKVSALRRFLSSLFPSIFKREIDHKKDERDWEDFKRRLEHVNEKVEKEDEKELERGGLRLGWAQ